MRALSIRQPWAWLIVHGGKDIENRSWSTGFRGRVLVHAAKGMTRREYEDALDFIVIRGIPPLPFDFPAFEHLERGGVIGSVEIADCVATTKSRWFMGPRGLVLRDPQPMPFVPFRGQLGFFHVPDELIADPEVHGG